MEDVIESDGYDPTAMPMAAACRLLTAASGHPITPEMIGKDLQAGCPANADGTLNLVHYVAWMIAEEP